MTRASKPRSDKRNHKTNAKPGPNAKHGTEPSQTKGKRRSKVGLEQAISALGGGKEDLAMLKDVSANDELIQGEQEVDPQLADDVSSFLQGLKSGTESKVEHEKKPQSKGPKELKQKQKQNKAEPRDSEGLDRKVEVELASSTAPAVTGVKTTAKSKLVFPPNPHWYTALPPLPPSTKPFTSPTASQISSLSEKASSLLNSDAAAYQSSSAFTGNSASDSHFLNTILSKGTLSDRLSALTLLVQASPAHNTKALETLKSMAERGRGKGGRDEGLKAMRCVVDWWVGGGAAGRKLKYFRDQPLLHPSVTDEHILVWYFEDWLKKYFFSILQILETYSLDTLPYVRTQALGFITTLLREKPEQEQNLLRLLVNKLGDTERPVCSRASYHLLQLLQSHPAMKGVIVREIRALIFRPSASTSVAAQQALASSTSNIHIRFDNDEKSTTKPKGKDVAKSHTMERWNSHAWYYSGVTLNQVVLTSTESDREVARILIDIYFEMFREILGGIKNSVSGPGDAEKVEGKEDGKQKPFKKGKAKEVRGDAGFAEVEDANSRLISAVLTGVNRALPFAKVDMLSGDDVFVKHIDTLFLITHTSTFNISLQALMLILQVATTLPEVAASTSKDDTPGLSTSLKDRFYRTLYASLLDQRLANSNKQAMYLNLLFKALKADTNVERVKSFVRRFIQILAVGVSSTGGVEFIAGGLYLLGELFSTVSGLRAMFNVSPSEKFDDTYDPKKRDPQYAHASSSPLYELLPLMHHYHPAVSLHARQLFTARPITATADLSLNTISHFLDRFVYKNPKKPKSKGASAMQPAAAGVDSTSVKLLKGEVMHGEGPVNEEKWWKRRVEDVPVDEIFFHKYFTQKSKKEKEMKEKVKKRKGKDDEDEKDEERSDVSSSEDEDAVEKDTLSEPEQQRDEDDEEEDSDQEEAEIWKAMKATLPSELQDDDLSADSDDVPSDLDEDSDEEDAEVNDNEDDSTDEEEDVQDNEDDEDALSLVEASDAEDLLSLDAEIPGDLIEYDGTDSEAGGENEEWGGIGGATMKKRKRSGVEDKKKRKKIRSLPTFASYEDYAKMIEDGPEDNI